MTEHDDATMLAIVGNSLAGVHMDTPVGDVTARGRKLRHRRTAATGLVTAGIAAIATLAVTLPSSGGGAATAKARQTTTIAQGVNVDNAAWSVHTNADSTVSVTLRQLVDPALLQRILAEAGVRTRVQVVDNTLNSCTSRQRILPQSRQVISSREGGQIHSPYMVTIKPSAMPPGSVVSIILDEQGRGEYFVGRPFAFGYSITLVHGTPATCVSH